MAAIATTKSCKLVYKGTETVGVKNYTRTTNLGAVDSTVMTSANGPDLIMALGNAWAAIAAYLPGQGVQTVWTQTYLNN